MNIYHTTILSYLFIVCKSSHIWSKCWQFADFSLFYAPITLTINIYDVWAIFSPRENLRIFKDVTNIRNRIINVFIFFSQKYLRKQLCFPHSEASLRHLFVIDTPWQTSICSFLCFGFHSKSSEHLWLQRQPLVRRSRANKLLKPKSWTPQGTLL